MKPYYLFNNDTIAANGSKIIAGFDSSDIVLLINIVNAPTGTSPTLVFTLQEVDPVDQTTLVGGTVSSSVISSALTTTLKLTNCISNTVKMSWVIGGTSTPTFTGVNASVIQKISGGTVTVVQSGSTVLNSTGAQGAPNTIGNAWPMEVTDGTNVLGTSAHPLRTDPTGTTTQPITGVGSAGTPASGVVTIQGISGGTAVPVSGSITATNASISTTGSAPPASATYIGGSVTTSAPTYTTGQMSALSLTTAGSLRVDGAGGSFPVSGSVTVVQPTGSNLNAVVSGTVTANIGTTNGLALDATLAKLTIAPSTALGSNTLAMVGGSVTTAAPAYTTGNINPLSLTTAGSLRTDNSSWFGSTAPTVGSKTSANSIPVVIASDQGAVTVNASATVGLVDNNAFTDGTTRVQPIGFILDEVAGTALTENDTAAARIDSKRAIINVLEDATTRGTRNTIKAASTAAVATDTALVVAISPNSSTVTANIGTTNGLALDATVAKLTVAQGAALGSNTQAMVGGSVTTAAPAYTTGNINPLSLTTSGALRTDSSATTQPVSGAVTVSQATAANLNATVVGTGSDNTTNSTTKLPTLSALSNTSAPSWTDGYMVPLSVDASGSLRITGSVSTSNASISAVNASPPSYVTYVGGSVTTAAPAYTTGQMSALSLTTAGLLRVDGAGGTFPVSGSVTVVQPTGSNLNAVVSGTVTANVGTTNGLALDATLSKLTITPSTAVGSNTVAMVGGSVSTAAPTYTTGNINPLSLTTAGLLRVDASGTTQAVTVSSGALTANIGTTNGLALDATLAKLTVAQSTALGTNTQAMVGGSVTTAAPTYTTGNINPLSLTTAGLLRVDASGTTQAVTVSSGTLTANIGTTNGLALDATLSKLTVAQSTALGSNTQALMGGSVTTAAPTYTTGNINPLSLTTTGALRTDSSATTQPVSGSVTVSQATAASLNATVIGNGADNTANSTAKLPTLSARANTSAPSWTDGNMVPLSVDASGSLRVTGSISASNPSVSTTGSAPPASATYIGGSVTTNAPAYTTGQMSPLSLTTAGSLRVDGYGGTFTVTQPTFANLNTTSKLTDGTTTATIKAGSTLPTASDSALVVTLSPNFATDAVVTGSLNAINQTVTIATAGHYTVGGNILGTWVGTIISEGSVDGGATWFAIRTANKSTNNIVFQYTANDNFEFYSHGGCTHVRMRVSAYTSGTLNVSLAATSGAQDALLNYSGTDGDGAPPLRHLSFITFDNGGTPRLTKTANSTPAGTEYGLITRNIPSGTQAVSGTVTANVGTTNGLALDASVTAQTLIDNNPFTDGTSRVQPSGYILDETAGTALTENDAAAARIDSKRAQIFVIEDATTRGTRNTVKPASTAAVSTDTSLVVAINPNSSTVTANIGTTNGLALDATVAKLTIAPSTALGSNTLAMVGGSVTTAAPTYTTGNINPLSLTTTGLLRIDGSSVTQPVSGTVTANVGTTGGLALDTTVTKLTIALNNPLGSNTQTLMGGSVTTAAPTYTTGNINPLSLTTAGALRVDSSTTTQPVSGTITANQGTAASLANAWSTKITDATNGPVAVKAANTAPVAADPALVVTISPNSDQLSTATLSNTSSSTSSVTLLASNTARQCAIIVNDSTSVLYVKFGSAASSTSYTYRLISNAFLEMPQPIYTGIITGVWVSVNGAARCTEVTL